MAKKEFEQEKMDKLIEQANEWKVEFIKTKLFTDLATEVKAHVDIILDTFVTKMYQEELRLPREWTGATVEKTLVEVFPTAVKDFNEVSFAVVPLLTAYFNFLQENKKIGNGATLVRKLEKLSFTEVKKEETSKKENIKEVKTVKSVSKANKNKYSQAEIDTFNMFPMGNYQFKAATPAQAPKLAVNYENVGRNESCPCGSGQKYKKCHGK